MDSRLRGNDEAFGPRFGVIPAKAGIHAFFVFKLVEISVQKSFHAGLFSSINLTFQLLFHFLICFSRIIASFGDECASK